VNIKKPSIVAIFSAFLLSLILLITFIPAILAAPLELIVLNTNSYIQLLSQPDLQSELTKVFSEQIVLRIPGYHEMENSRIYLNVPYVKTILKSGITTPWIEREFTAIVNQLILFLNFRTPDHQLTIGMTDYKNDLRKNSVSTAKIILNDLPHCTSAQEEIISNNKLLTFKDVPICRPSPSLLPITQTLIQNGIDDLATQIPAEIQIIDLFTISSQFYTYYSVLRWLIRLSPLIFFLSLLGISLLLRRSRKLMLGWIGWLICIPSFLFLIVVGIALVGFDQFASLIVTRSPIFQNAGFGGIILLGLQLIGFQFFIWVFIILLIFLVVGIILVIAARSIKQQAEPDFLEEKRKLIEGENSPPDDELPNVSKSRKNKDS